MFDSHALKAAAFIAQVLELDGDPAEIARDVVSLKRDANAGISTVELDSSVGTAAFLVYDYQLAVRDAEGRTGQALFDADVQTLERAAEVDSPGPRILAHAVAGDEAFILATTPAVYRALTGQAEPAGLEASEADLLPGAATEAARAEAAGELMRLLREAETQAARWLRAIQAESKLGPANGDAGDLVAFGEAESALALFVLDDRSIPNLLKALNVLVGAAREQAAEALGRRQTGSDEPGAAAGSK